MNPLNRDKRVYVRRRMLENRTVSVQERIERRHFDSRIRHERVDRRSSRSRSVLSKERERSRSRSRSRSRIAKIGHSKPSRHISRIRHDEVRRGTHYRRSRSPSVKRRRNYEEMTPPNHRPSPHGHWGSRRNISRGGWEVTPHRPGARPYESNRKETSPSFTLDDLRRRLEMQQQNIDNFYYIASSSFGRGLNLQCNRQPMFNGPMANPNFFPSTPYGYHQPAAQVGGCRDEEDRRNSRMRSRQLKLNNSEAGQSRSGSGAWHSSIMQEKHHISYPKRHGRRRSTGSTDESSASTLKSSNTGTSSIEIGSARDKDKKNRSASTANGKERLTSSTRSSKTNSFSDPQKRKNDTDERKKYFDQKKSLKKTSNPIDDICGATTEKHKSSRKHNDIFTTEVELHDRKDVKHNDITPGHSRLHNNETHGHDRSHFPSNINMSEIWQSRDTGGSKALNSTPESKNDSWESCSGYCTPVGYSPHSPLEKWEDSIAAKSNTSKWRMEQELLANGDTSPTRTPLYNTTVDVDVDVFPKSPDEPNGQMSVPGNTLIQTQQQENSKAAIVEPCNNTVIERDPRLRLKRYRDYVAQRPAPPPPPTPEALLRRGENMFSEESGDRAKFSV